MRTLLISFPDVDDMRSTFYWIHCFFINIGSLSEYNIQILRSMKKNVTLFWNCNVSLRIPFYPRKCESVAVLIVLGSPKRLFKVFFMIMSLGVLEEWAKILLAYSSCDLKILSVYSPNKFEFGDSI